MALRVEMKSSHKLSGHLFAYIAGRHAACRDVWIRKARDTYNQAERARLIKDARFFHHSYLAYVRGMP